MYYRNGILGVAARLGAEEDDLFVVEFLHDPFDQAADQCGRARLLGGSSHGNLVMDMAENGGVAAGSGVVGHRVLLWEQGGWTLLHSIRIESPTDT